MLGMINLLLYELFIKMADSNFLKDILSFFAGLFSPSGEPTLHNQLGKVGSNPEATIF